jgi:hypothetical protein
MPRKSINYQKTIIYHFVCNDKSITDTYVGHTTNFVERKAHHKRACCNENYKEYNRKLYQNMRENGGWENWNMIPLEECPCENMIQAIIKEQYWIDKLQARMNDNKAYTSYEQKLENMRVYYVEHKEEIKVWNKKYVEENKEMIAERNHNRYEENKEEIQKIKQQKINCECGGRYTINHRATHFKTPKHISFLCDEKSHNIVMTSTTKANRWCLHIKDYARKTGISYREAMRSEACKTAYKTPVAEIVAEPVPVAVPESVPEPLSQPKRGRKKADPMPVPVLVRSPSFGQVEAETIPTIVKKERVKRQPKMVPT